MAKALLVLPALVWLGSAHAQHMFNGSTGYINTPSALMRPDGTMVLGFSHAAPYTSVYGAMQLFPQLEAIGRFQQTTGVPDFVNTPGANYGSYKDKSVGFKVQILKDSSLSQSWLPALALGVDDLGIGTQAFQSTYAVASKSFDSALGSLELSLGAGQKRIQGALGGMRFSPATLPNWALVADYDRINFKNDVGAALVGLDQRPVGRLNAMLEYRSPASWGFQVGMRDGKPSVNVSMSGPLGERTLVPKTAEREPYISFAPRPIAWRQGDASLNSLVVALHADGFRQMSVSYDAGIANATLTSGRYINSAQAAGRAMRILLAHAPQDARKIRLTQTIEGMPSLVYTAHDLDVLQAYFVGSVTHKEVLRTLEMAQAAPTSGNGLTPAQRDNLLSEVTLAAQFKGVSENQTGLTYDKSMGAEYPGGSDWRLSPVVDVFFNDPSGALKLSLGLSARSRLQIAPGMNLDTAVSATLVENISDVTQPSNSLLPHVRTDVAEYYRSGRVKLQKVVLNQYWKASEQVYARASVGLYELMFGGFGGQLLYVPAGSNWSADVSADYLVQRDFNGVIQFRDYKVLSGFASVHMKLPYDITGTVRAGRFLAKDKGLRFELKREYPSGVQLGAWFTKTDGKDTTNPGTPANPYNDKGIVMSMPFDVFSPKHSGRIMNMSISPWTRDVGQMVQSPGDLAQTLERSVVNSLYRGKNMSGLGGVDAEDK